jgi:hypothetical protein
LSRSRAYATAFPSTREAEESTDGAFGGQVDRIGAVLASASVRDVLVIKGAIGWSDAAWKSALVGIIDLKEEGGKGEEASVGVGNKATGTTLSTSAMGRAQYEQNIEIRDVQ